MAIVRRLRPRTSLAGRSVLITGAARAIGAAALTRKASARGARVALVGLEPQLPASVADELGPEHLSVEADVTDAEALEAAVRRTVDVRRAGRRRRQVGTHRSPRWRRRRRMRCPARSR